MSYYVHDGNLSYSDYLTAKSFADDITRSTHGAGQRVAMEISHSTREILASDQALAAENIRVMEASTDQIAGALNTGFGQVTSALDAGFSQMVNALDSGFDRLSYNLDGIRLGISELTASFHWGFCQMLTGIGHMNDSFSQLIQIAKTPAQTAAFEQYEIARDAFRQGLYQECLESLEKAISGDHVSAGYKLEWRFHQMKGILCLGFFGSDMTLVDLAKAEESFLLAARYAKAGYAEHSAQAFLSAGWAAYCQGKMPAAIGHCEQAIFIYPSLGEAFFLAAKARMALGEVDAALPILGNAIKLDRFFSLKAAGDGDFKKYDNRVHDFLDAMRQEQCQQALTKVRAALDRVRFWLENTKESTRNEKVRRMVGFSARGASLPLIDILAVVQTLDDLIAAIEKKAKEAVIQKRTCTPVTMQVEECYDVEEIIPETETYQEEVVVRPASFFRRAVIELETRTRTVMKKKIVEKTRKISRESEQIQDEYYDGFGTRLPDSLAEMKLKKRGRC